MNSSSTIPLHIEEPTGVRRERWPICWGVPFPQGALFSPAHVRLRSPTGMEVPCHVRETARWPDGSVKWMLLQFQATLEPQEQATYTVEFGAKVQRNEGGSPLKVEELADEIRVDTGPLRFVVNKRRFALLEQVWLDDHPMLRADTASGARDAQRLWIADADGTVYELSGDPSPTVRVEEATPQRITIHARGRHLSQEGRKLFDYEVRIYAYAGLPRVDVEYTFIHTEKAEYTTIREIALRTGMHLQGKGIGLCGAGKKLYEFSEPFYCVHRDVMVPYGVFQGSPIYRADGKPVGGVGMYEQGLARGWMDLSDGKWGVMIAMRDFVVSYPKKAEVRDDAITFHIWPEEAEPLVFHQGMAKTHRLMFTFHRGTGREARVHEIGMCADEPLLPWNGPWVSESKVFGDVFPHKPKTYPRTERALRDLSVGYRDRRMLGMVDYGDYGGATTGHRKGFTSNNEHDVPYGLLLQWLRTGERIPYHVAESGIEHTMDIDIVHYTSRSPIELGGWRIHGPGHVQYDPEGFPDVSVAPSHMWTESLVAYYYLSGHPRALQTARGIGDCFLRMIEEGWATPPYHSEWHSARDSGWTLIGLSAVYEATGEEKYLKGIQKVAQALIEAQHENGGWPIVFWFHVGYCPFQIGIALTGLMRAHQLTGDEAIQRAFLKGMDFLAGEAMRFPDGAWCYVTAPEYRSSYTSHTPLEPFGYAYALTRNPWYIQQGLIHYGEGLDLRADLRFLYWADRGGMLHDVS